ncbi:MAG TPA: YihY/virulence factor BrkB family protein [Bacteroidia bacterium]|nr:YihY/virulence factor BrkB family protein [Bacteroidia bacterium]
MSKAVKKQRGSKLGKKLLRLIFALPVVKQFIAYTKRIALPGFEKMPIYDVADFFFTGIQRGSIVTRAQSLAFSFFLAIFPAIIFLFSLIPYVPIANFQNEILNIIEGVLPQNAYSTVRSTIEDIIRIQRGGLLSIGFVMALYFTTNGFMTMMRGFNSSYHVVESRTPFQQRKVAIVLTFILSVLVIISTTLIIFSEVATKYLVTHSILKSKTQILLLTLGKWTVVMSLFFFAISFLYYYAPAVKKNYRFISAGSTFATMLSIIVSTGFAYFVNNFGQYNKIYGSIGTLIVIMLWIYFNSVILILGFELNASIENAKNRVRREF